MKITQATSLRPPRRGIHILADSLPAILKPTPQSLLDRGVAILADAEDAEFPWVNNLAYHLDGDETNLEAGNKIVGATVDPVIVCLARRYRRAMRNGGIRPGPVKIPTLEDALDELKDSPAWQSFNTAYVAAA